MPGKLRGTCKTYKDYHIEGISEDYPIGKRDFTFSNKIIVTYKSLPRLSERITTSSYNLLIDEGHMLAAMSGYAPEDSPLFGVKVTSLKEICEIYDEDPARCFNEHYEWFLVFEELGTDLCKSYKYDKNKVKSLYDRAVQEKSPDLQAAVTRFFKVGSTYSAKDIKQTLKNMGLENAKGTSLAKWFHTKRVNSNGVMSLVELLIIFN